MKLEELRRRARQLAESPHALGGSSRTRLLERLDANARRIRDSYRRVKQLAENDGTIAEAGTWLLDNYYLIQEQIRVARHDLPRGYSRGLPQSLEGTCRGLPRVYTLALELFVRIDGRLNRRRLREFLDAYQSVGPLTLGELWAVPIMLRLAAIETLAHVAKRIGACQQGALGDAADVRAIRDGVASLRMLGALDWKQLVERESAVEQILRSDPAGIYERMDFGSRDRYRHVVERLAQHSTLSEQDVAKLALELTNTADGRDDGAGRPATTAVAEIRRHVGYFLVDEGLGELERLVNYRPER
ncbi:MAG: hypothetical protein LLG00_09315, partial [Planctomycetaceae bacterium]|nr:hypothetical protein [Planctomycetaceae bacterium]